MPARRIWSLLYAWLFGVILSLTLGVLWGIVCWWGDDVRWPMIGMLANAGGPWLLLAFLIGTLTGAPVRGPVCGALALGAAVLTYYAAYDIARIYDPAADPRYFIPGGAAWLAVAVPAGAAFGAAGAVWRAGPRRLRAAALVLLSGALLSEALLALPDLLTYADLERGYWLGPASEALLALGLPAVLLPWRREALAGLTATLVVAAVGLEAQTRLLEYLQVNFRA
jgi:hypothetical protein